MSTDPIFHFIPGQHYECTACGKCCKGKWNIAVDQNAYDIISHSEVFRRKLEAGYLPLVVSEDKRASVGRDSSGACVFLRADNLCELHAELGEASKPVVCRTYPQVITETPDGYFVSLSFSCPAVLSQVGPPIEAQSESLKHLLLNSRTAVPQNAKVSDNIFVGNGESISWSEYVRLEKHLLSGFRTRFPATSVLAMTEQLALADSAEALSVLLKTGFDRKGVASPYGSQLLAVFSAHCISILELEEKPEARGDFFSQLISDKGVWSERFSCHLPPFTSHPESTLKESEQIEHYFQNLVLGKRLLGDSLLESLLNVAVGMNLLVYYLEALKNCDSPWTYRELAFDLIEGDVLTHSRGLELLLRELPSALLESLRVSNHTP